MREKELPGGLYTINAACVVSFHLGSMYAGFHCSVPSNMLLYSLDDIASLLPFIMRGSSSWSVNSLGTM